MTMLVPRRLGRRAPAIRGVRPFTWDLADFDGVIDELWRGFGAEPRAQLAEFTPRVDVHESETEYRVTAELPGLEEKDFDVSLDGDVLTLKGEKRHEHEEDRNGYRHVERSHGRFERRFQLPSDVDAGKVAASYEAGVLTVTLPKAESSKPRTIEVTKA